MTRKRWSLIRQVALEAMELEGDKRSSFIRSVAGDDEDLIRRVERLFESEAEAGDTFEQAVLAEAVAAGESSLLGQERDPIASQVSHYRIEEKIGEGGMGVVYRALDNKLNRPVALKFLSRGFARPEEKKRFLREAQAAAALNHPQICPIHEIDEVDGRLFFAMALIEGRTVDEIAREGKVPIDELLDIAIQVSQGLEAAHAQQIVHRDIKSPNIIVDNQGRAVILDFGLAQVDDGAKLTESGMAMGTAGYMSPEQTLGEEVDARSDIWSLGVVIYEMATGTLPFDSEYPLATLYAIVNTDPASLDELRPDAPEALARLVSRTLEKDRSERHQSATELKNDLLQLKRQLGAPSPLQQASESGGPGLVSALGAFVRRNPWRTASILVAALALALVVFRGAVETVPSPTTAASGTVMPGARDLYEQALNYLERYERPENIDMAIELFQEVLAQDNDSALAHAGLGQAYWRMFMSNKDRKWLDGARNSSERAVELNPGLAQAHATLGLVQSHLGRTGEAEEHLGRALELDSENVDAVRGLAGVYDAQGRKQEAEEQYKKAIELAPGDWTGYKSLGVFYFAQDRYQEAEEQFRAVVRLTPDNATGYANLGAVVDLQGQTDEAARLYRKSISLAPSPTAYTNLGTIQYFQGAYSDAVDSYRNAIDLRPNSDTYWGNLGDAYRQRGAEGDPERVTEAYLRAIELAERQLTLNPADAYRRSRMAFWLAYVGRRKDADSEISQALSLEADSARVRLEAAVLYEFVGERENARREYNAALDAGYSASMASKHPDLKGVSTTVEPAR